MNKSVLNSELTGTSLLDYETSVNWRDIMNYSAAIGDANPRYFDDESPDGIIAHPVYPVALTWNIIGRIQEFIVSEKFPTELLLSQVHYTEHLAIHRPLLPGLQLIIKGQIVAILPHRAGTHVVIRLVAREKEGTPVFTEHIGAMLRGVECIGGEGQESLPIVQNVSDAVEPCWTSTLSIDKLMPFIYDGCTDIVFPIHTSIKFARMVGLPGIILQGTATLALAVTELVNRELKCEPARVKSVSCRFTGMVLPGSNISIRMIEKRKNNTATDLLFDVCNINGGKIISSGCLSAD
jgi:3-hydroxymyristoyl/3-hydroxydecanoyl-(acyl carrier protein) dehydratase